VLRFQALKDQQGERQPVRLSGGVVDPASNVAHVNQGTDDMRYLLCAATLSVLLTVGAEANESDDAMLFRRDTLEGALADIAKMPEPELHALTRYLAKCDVAFLSVGTAPSAACNAAYVAYRIEFAAKAPDKANREGPVWLSQRAIDDLMMARASRDYDMAERYARPESDEQMRKVADEGAILVQLENAVNARFRELRVRGSQ
jgi:hypothetical protein